MLVEQQHPLWGMLRIVFAFFEAATLGSGRCLDAHGIATGPARRLPPPNGSEQRHLFLVGEPFTHSQAATIRRGRIVVAWLDPDSRRSSRNALQEPRRFLAGQLARAPSADVSLLRFARIGNALDNFRWGPRRLHYQLLDPRPAITARSGSTDPQSQASTQASETAKRSHLSGIDVSTELAEAQCSPEPVSSGSRSFVADATPPANGTKRKR
jgi:hypothetical protein